MEDFSANSNKERKYKMQKDVGIPNSIDREGNWWGMQKQTNKSGTQEIRTKQSPYSYFLLLLKDLRNENTMDKSKNMLSEKN